MFPSLTLARKKMREQSHSRQSKIVGQKIFSKKDDRKEI